MALDAPADYIVIFKDGVNIDRKVSKEAALGNSVSDVFTAAADGFVAELDDADLTRLRKYTDVLLIERDRPIRIIDDTVSTSKTSTSPTVPATTAAPGPTLDDLAGTVIPG